MTSTAEPPPGGPRGRPRDEIAVSIVADGWTDGLTDPADICRTAAGAAIAAAGPALPVELSILLADDAELRRLNRIYRGRDAATNVLSFPANATPADAPAHSGEPLLLGDVAIAAETAAAEAQASGKALSAHLSHLIVHGTLHLLGHDHEADRDAFRMEDLERRILAGLGVADPYAAPPDEHQR